jgi:magnesium chelatase subunit H
MLAARVARWSRCAAASAPSARSRMVLFNFPPNAGNTGTAAFLSVFESLHNTLLAMQREGYTSRCRPRRRAARPHHRGQRRQVRREANVHAASRPTTTSARALAARRSRRSGARRRAASRATAANIFVLGERFGNVFVGIQPAFGYEGDPMRLLFEKGFAPTHAFSAFYRWLREDFGATRCCTSAPTARSSSCPASRTACPATCWPDRLIGDLPNLYLYASNNPSEGTIAKRRAAATLISYLTPPVAQAGLYKRPERPEGLDRALARPGARSAGRARELAPLIQAQAAELELAPAEPPGPAEAATSASRAGGPPCSNSSTR